MRVDHFYDHKFSHCSSCAAKQCQGAFERLDYFRIFAGRMISIYLDGSRHTTYNVLSSRRDPALFVAHNAFVF